MGFEETMLDLSTGRPAWLAMQFNDVTWDDLPTSGPERSEALVILALRSMTYEDYLRTGHWHEVAERTKRASGWRCLYCGARATDAHHVTYRNKGCEQPQDTVAACRDCHTEFHLQWRPVEE